jgi:hypothetical protein
MVRKEKNQQSERNNLNNVSKTAIWQRNNPFFDPSQVVLSPEEKRDDHGGGNLKTNVTPPLYSCGTPFLSYKTQHSMMCSHSSKIQAKLR